MAAARGEWWGRLALVALVVNGFAVVTVNYWIYTARWDFIDGNPGYRKPPTISRAISDPTIGEPFSAWVTLSGLLLVLGVWVLALHYLRLLRALDRPRRYLRLSSRALLPAIMLLQPAASVGMYLLSNFRFPDANVAHMVGSYLFFVSQALVVLLFTVYNHALLRDRTSLDRLVAIGALRRRWVRIRYRAGLASVALIAVYFTLFRLKDVYEYPEAPGLYIAYVTTEPVVISSFLLVLGLCHADLHGRRRG